MLAQSKNSSGNYIVLFDYSPANFLTYEEFIEDWTAAGNDPELGLFWVDFWDDTDKHYYDKGDHPPSMQSIVLSNAKDCDEGTVLAAMGEYDNGEVGVIIIDPHEKPPSGILTNSLVVDAILLSAACLAAGLLLGRSMRREPPAARPQP